MYEWWVKTFFRQMKWAFDRWRKLKVVFLHCSLTSQVSDRGVWTFHNNTDGMKLCSAKKWCIVCSPLIIGGTLKPHIPPTNENWAYYRIKTILYHTYAGSHSFKTKECTLLGLMSTSQGSPESVFPGCGPTQVTWKFPGGIVLWPRPCLHWPGWKVLEMKNDDAAVDKMLSSQYTLSLIIPESKDGSSTTMGLGSILHSASTHIVTHSL